MPPPMSRRAALRLALLGGTVLGVSACEGPPSRRRDTSPTGTVEPDRPETWLVDTDLFISARERVHQLRQTLASGAPGRGSERALAGSLEQLWAAQQERLEQLIVLAGVPLPDLPESDADADADADADDQQTATARPTGDGQDGEPTRDDSDEESTGDDSESTATATSPPPDPVLLELGAQLRHILPEVVAEVATASPVNLAVLTSLTAQHAASAGLLGSPVQWEALAGPTGAAAVTLLAVTRPAIFGLEVVAARSRDEERATYEAILSPLRTITRQLTTLAGPAAPVPPLGYALPPELETSAQRLALAQELVGDVAPAALTTADRVRGDAEALTGVVRIVAESLDWSELLDVPPVPFPGMTLP